MNLADDLKARGLVEHFSAPLEKIFEKKRTVYLGVDPTADSMQAGNLVVVLLLKRLADAGNKVILLVGGGTGMIGDPKERGERSLSDPKVVATNKRAIQKQMESIIGKRVPVVDNASWLLDVKLVDFLRDIGKHFTINELVKRDIIRRRLETPDESISYTEFAYSLLQGYDFLHLNRTKGVDLQIGGSDQWTNILSGVELIRRKDAREAFALTCPLVTDATGKKFGKSEGNAVWLDAKKTSPFAFYQFWMNLPDQGLETYLKLYTFMSLEEIGELMKRHASNPGGREAQKSLAKQVTEVVHGISAAAHAAAATEALFGGTSLSNLGKEDRAILLREAKTHTIARASLATTKIADALAESGLSSSKSDARRLIEGKGITLNGRSVENVDQILTEAAFTDGLALLKKGKRDVVILVLK